MNKKAHCLKDSIMMPPPKARPKSIRSDTSDELRKNLIETASNYYENNVLQEELYKFYKELEENEKKPEEEQSSITSNSFERVPRNDQLNVSKTNDEDSYCYKNYGNLPCVEGEEEEFNQTRNILNLKENLTNTKRDLERALSLDRSITKYCYSTFRKLPKPSNKIEIKDFTANLLSFLKTNEFDSKLMTLKIKLETRYNDYKNKALNSEYFLDSLMRMQEELISRIYLASDNSSTDSSKRIETS